MDVFGLRLVGINADTGHKALLTLALIVAFLVVRFAARALILTLPVVHDERGRRFWFNQILNIVTGGLLCLGLLSIWFDNPHQMATGLGFFTAGLAFALQKVITSFAGYLVLLRGHSFRVGDRIVMGGVRGDVIALGFMQTTIMEMGEPPSVQSAAPAVWVTGRQFTGRIVTVTNDKIFEEPVYNYSRDFPLIWEEMRIPISYKDDYAAAERILIDVAERHTATAREEGRAGVNALMDRYAMPSPDLSTKVFYRITDNWVELALRFLAPSHGARELKDSMSRDILQAFAAAGIGIASGTYDIVGLPPIRLADATPTEREPRKPDPAQK